MVRSTALRLLASSLLVAACWPGAAGAFCGFFVATHGTDLTNGATQVALMRDGTRTVLSMRNDYRGPVSDFAMVVPVPTVLTKEQVKTLPEEVFDRLEELSAPRLVEYWEQDPCPAPRGDIYDDMQFGMAEMAMDAPGERSHGVTVEARFAVGEYRIEVLGARDSMGLETWLREQGYRIPAGAAKLLRPYVQAGMKFFVAKVDATKVTFDGDRAVLSPLRFHYDSEDFTLPIRLGMANSAGAQDLLVFILSPQSRYAVANRPNVTIPTNLDLRAEALERFGEFYAALFTDTLRKQPGAVVTEYAWSTNNCDPCPGPGAPLQPQELLTLGGDVLWAGGGFSPPPDPEALPPPPKVPQRFVLTRLHARYGKDLKDDLVFEQANAIVGGREAGGAPREVQTARVNNFQARYAIRHPWTGPVDCETPQRGMWGGPPAGTRPSATRAAVGVTEAPSGKTALDEFLKAP